MNRTNNVVPNNSCSHVGGEKSLLQSFYVWVFLLALTLEKLRSSVNNTRSKDAWLFIALAASKTWSSYIINFLNYSSLAVLACD